MINQHQAAMHEQLLDEFAEQLPHWSKDQIRTSALLRFAEAYLMMASAEYRPQAPRDGVSHNQLSDAEFDDSQQTCREAFDYAVRMRKYEDTGMFPIGSTSWTTSRATLLTIEAARRMCSGIDGESYALRLLKLAIKDIVKECAKRDHAHE